MELTLASTPRASRYRLLRHLRTAGRPVPTDRVAALYADGETLRCDLDDLAAQGVVQVTADGVCLRYG